MHETKYENDHQFGSRCAHSVHRVTSLDKASSLMNW